jgi:hypothetical protein
MLADRVEVLALCEPNAQGRGADFGLIQFLTIGPSVPIVLIQYPTIGTLIPIVPANEDSRVVDADGHVNTQMPESTSAVPPGILSDTGCRLGCTPLLGAARGKAIIRPDGHPPWAVASRSQLRSSLDERMFVNRSSLLNSPLWSPNMDEVSSATHDSDDEQQFKSTASLDALLKSQSGRWGSTLASISSVDDKQDVGCLINASRIN